jgi:hypothetical protein
MHHAKSAAAKWVGVPLFVVMVCASGAAAQSPGPTQYGEFSGRYPAPNWGQSNPPNWGAYTGTIGDKGWRFNRPLQSNEPDSAIADPDQSLTFGNPRTGATLFRPQDTRLKGRDRP